MAGEKQANTFGQRLLQWTKARPWATLLVIMLLVAVGVIWYWAIWADSSPAWTGFGAYDEEVSGPRAKTLWDWLGLLIVPAALAAGAYWLNRSQKDTELKIAEKARDKDREIAEQARVVDRETAEKARAAEMEIATNRQRQATLEAYYDRMTELLLEHKLRESAAESELRSIARARTIAIVPSLDAKRNRQLFAFLKASKLMERDAPIIELSEADLSTVELSGVNLIGANLRMADLRMADLSHADLSYADLSGAILLGVDLSGANLSGANLSDSYLLTANLRGTNLFRANLCGAYLSEAADLRNANNWTIEQLDQAGSLINTTMPDHVRLGGQHHVHGPSYDEWKAQYLARQSEANV